MYRNVEILKNIVNNEINTLMNILGCGEDKLKIRIER